jgi:endoplasmic reticulum-Golgi intermediate compartment protein 3
MITFNISFKYSPCHGLSVDYQDITGTHLEDIQHDIYKLRLNSEGNIINQRQYDEVVKLVNKNYPPSSPKRLFSSHFQTNDCYGAELYVG